MFRTVMLVESVGSNRYATIDRGLSLSEAGRKVDLYAKMNPGEVFIVENEDNGAVVWGALYHKEES